MVAALQNGLVELSFTAVAGRTYTVLSTDTLPSGGNWQRRRDVSAGATQTVIVTDTLVERPQRFYRVVTPAVP